MKVIIIGIGLIGGSFAKDIRRLYPGTLIYGMDVNPAHLEEAKTLGLIDHIAGKEELPEADMLLLSIPVDALVEELPAVLDMVKDDAVVMDAGSTKSLVCRAVEDHPKRRNL